MLQETWEYGYLFEIVILFPLAVYPEVGLVDHMVGLFLIFWGNFILFPVVAEAVYIPVNRVQGFFFLHHVAKTCLFLVIAILRGVSWYIVVVWICISLRTSNAPFHISAVHLHVFCGKMSIQGFCPLLIVCFDMVVWVPVNPWSDRWFVVFFLPLRMAFAFCWWFHLACKCF